MNPQALLIGALALAPFVFSATPCFAEEQNQAIQSELVKRGEEEAAHGNWREAVEQFYKAANEDEKNPIAFYDLGVAYLHLGDLNKAQLAEEQAIKLKPDFINAYVQLATVQSKIGDASSAENTLRKALELDPNNQTVQANLKAVLEGKEQRDNSLKNTTTTATNTPASIENSSASSAPTETSVATKVPTTPENNASTEVPVNRETSTVPDVSTTQTKTVTDTVVSSPSNVQTTTATTAATTNATESERKSPEALAETKQATPPANANVVSSVIEEGTASLILDDILLHESKCRQKVKPELAARLDEAATALKNNQLEAAKKVLEQVIQEDSSVSCAYSSLGAIMGMEGDYDAEIAKEKIAIELDEHNGIAHCNLAWALAQKNRWQEALQENERALELEPGFMVAGVGKALAQSQLGFADQAKATLKGLIESNPSEVLPRLAMGAILDGEGATSASQAELSEVLKLKPESLTIKRWLAAGELKKQNWAGAQELYAQITKANPYDGQAWLGLGLALDRMGDQSNSLEALQKAVQMLPESATAHLALGLAFKGKGDSSAAAKELKEAHRINPKCALAEAQLKVQESGVK